MTPVYGVCNQRINPISCLRQLLTVMPFGFQMGVDNVRQIEIVTPTGDVLIANECKNTDVFHAVRGGGGGTYGVVTNITYKALPKFRVRV